MPKFTTRFLVALFTFIVGIAVTTIFFMRQRVRVVIPKDWGPDAFKIIDRRADEAQLPRLRTILLPNNAMEVRIWVGFGINGEDALILRRWAGQWSALHLHGMYKVYPPEKYQETFVLPAPKSGWENAWQRLVDTGILSLPDASEVQCETGILDGTSYGVEINMNRTYRIYSYDNPDHASCGQAKQIIEIGRIIAEEFGLDEFRINTSF